MITDPLGKECAIRIAAFAPMLAKTGAILIEPRKLEVESILRDLWKCPGESCAQYVIDMDGNMTMKRCGLVK